MQNMTQQLLGTVVGALYHHLFLPNRGRGCDVYACSATVQTTEQDTDGGLKHNLKTGLCLDYYLESGLLY